MPSPSVRRRRRVRVLTGVRGSGRLPLAALVGLLVAGILGMHALATHGTPAAVTASSGNVAVPVAGHAAELHGEAHRDHEGTTTGNHDMGSMVMLCVAMLAAAAVTLLVLLVGGSRGPLLPGAFEPAPVPARAPRWVRSTGPPHEWAFSVVRC
ncbi:DUF6153 family protein [Microbacterium sp. ARD31]|uniref:DUF6153 family protein n=1 Tax=Microbacterium sp. ARD31 TaxID=2962576 RepID=UPI002882BC30|nr:DUF6153 family protein [Microbacterium sp. ARD31]MDT0185945.1 DUF6153 family protein [Microbacterium sp. ARD31]